MREYRFTGSFQLVTPLRLSSGEEAELADVAVWRRADGIIVVPGTSIAGAFRTYVERLTGVSCKIAEGLPSRRSSDEPACGCAVCALFGDVRPGNDPNARASRLMFCDAVVEGAKVRVVDGVAIDRQRRTAAERRKFDFEEVIPGAQLQIEVRGHALENLEVGWIGTAFRALGAGRMPLGGGVAQGFGRLAARELTLRWRDTEMPEHLVVAVLNDAGEDAAWPETVDPFPGDDSAQPDFWEICFRLVMPPDSTFLVADPTEAIATGFDRAPRGTASSPDLPATSLRGALRSAAERILRTLDPNAACDPTDSKTCCAARERVAMERDEAFERCLACQVFGNEEWASWIYIDVSRVSDSSRGQPFDHVAIDRFTGGAREGLKFDALATAGAQFEVRLLAPNLPSEDRAWVTGLLALTLQDLHQGRRLVHVGRSAKLSGALGCSRASVLGQGGHSVPGGGVMAMWRAWSRRATDADLAEAVARLAGGSPQWCFVEGTTCSDFLNRDDVSPRIAEAWLVRIFGEEAELAARRTGFDSERPWLVRVISREPPAGSEWQSHELGEGEERTLVLYGTPDAHGHFVEGKQFRDPFRYPGVPATGDNGRALLVVQEHPATEGAPVVRWVALRAMG
jgi:CRISPR/Cas system CSM-associated protein Csm3 (group 7 of RAMP superfamily)